IEAIPALFKALRINCPDYGPDKAPLIILKGVSELLGFYQDAYPALHGKYDFPLMNYRPMGDTDCICRPQDLDRFDKIFQQAGNVYDTYGFGYLNLEQEKLNRKIVSTVSHLMYNFYQIGHLELHPFITRGKNLKSYPDELTPFLWETARPIQYQGETAWIPGIEASAIYHLCHAAAIKEIYSIVFHFKYEPERLLWEGFYADMEDCYLNRLEILFIFHLYKWYFFLRQYHWELDYPLVEKFLLKVPQYESIDLFLQFVQQVGPLKGDYLQPHLGNAPLSPEERLAQKHRVMEYCRKDNIFEESIPEETF
ncbi:MAG: nucleotidyltransferase family protein, partial [Cyanobacteria bacterium]|nr:nucleotidyltransferase family protein [Cyanobacteriota bacterium]